VVSRLQAPWKFPYGFGSRSGDPRFDWEDPRTWGAALEGADAAYVSYPDLVPGAAEAVDAFAALAVENGARRLVLLSGRGEDEAQRSEEALERSGADWTVVRCSFFMQNFSEGYFREPRSSRTSSREPALTGTDSPSRSSTSTRPDVVVAEVRYSGTFTATGRELDTQGCHVWKLRDGKVTAFRQYVDTSQLQAVTGTVPVRGRS
jgi:uncharacterized protein YbjT (DUF2867 family)